MTSGADLVVQLRAALPALQAEWPIRSLALFGARMRDDATDESDLDVLVEFAEPIPFSAVLAMEVRLAGITGVRIGLVSTAALKHWIGKRVREEAVVL